jgi:hypothetical protein
MAPAATPVGTRLPSDILWEKRTCLKQESMLRPWPWLPFLLLQPQGRSPLSLLSIICGTEEPYGGLCSQRTRSDHSSRSRWQRLHYQTDCLGSLGSLSPPAEPPVPSQMPQAPAPIPAQLPPTGQLATRCEWYSSPRANASSSSPESSLTQNVHILFPLLFKLIFLNYCCAGGTLWHLQKFQQCIVVEFTPPSFSFIPLPPFLE